MVNFTENKRKSKIRNEVAGMFIKYGQIDPRFYGVTIPTSKRKKENDRRSIESRQK